MKVLNNLVQFNSCSYTETIIMSLLLLVLLSALSYTQPAAKHFQTRFSKQAWAIDKQLQLIVNTMLFKTVIPQRI